MLRHLLALGALGAVVTSTLALDCTVNSTVAGRVVPVRIGSNAFSQPDVPGTLDYCIKRASTNPDVRILFNVPLAAPDDWYATIYLASWVDFTFQNMFPPNAANFGRVALLGDSQPLSRAALAARPADMPRVYLVKNESYNLQRRTEYGNVVLPYGLVVASSTTADIQFHGLGFHGFGPSTLTEYEQEVVALGSRQWTAPAALYLAGASGVTISRCHFNDSYQGVEMAYNNNGGINRMTYNVTVDSSDFTSTFVGVRLHTMWGFVVVSRSRFGVAGTGGVAIQATRNTNQYPAALQAGRDVLGNSDTSTWPIRPQDYYRSNQLVIDECTVQNQGTHALMPAFVQTTDETQTAALLLQADNVTITGGVIGPSSGTAVTNAGNIRNMTNFRMQNTVVMNATYGVLPVGPHARLINVTVRHCLRGVLISVDAVTPEIQGGLFEYNGNPSGFGGYGLFISSPGTVLSGVTVRSNYRTPLYFDPLAVRSSLISSWVYHNSILNDYSIFLGCPGCRAVNTYVGIGPDGDRPSDNGADSWFTPLGGFTTRNPRVGISVGSEAVGAEISGDPRTRSTACVISGHGVVGISVDADDVVVHGCIVGLNANGTLLAPNLNGMFIRAHNTTVGGSDPAIRTVISGQQFVGVSVESSAEMSTITNTHIGTDISGLTAMEPNGNLTIGNGRQGIVIRLGAGPTTIGGTQNPSLQVVVSGNGFNGGTFGVENQGASVTISNTMIGPARNGQTRVPASNFRPYFANLESNAFGNRQGGLVAQTGSAVSIIGTSSAPVVIGGNGFGEPGDGGARLASDGSGISLQRATRLEMTGVNVGVAADGATPLGNRLHGIDAFIGLEVLTDVFTISDSLLASGTDPRYPVPADLVNGGYAVRVQGYNATIQNSFIGTSRSGTAALGTGQGILVGPFADHSTISGCHVGGVASGAAINVTNARRVSLLSNWIGLSASTPLTTALANNGAGIVADELSHNVTVDNNHIGNSRNGAGVEIHAEEAAILNNFVGFDNRAPNFNCSNHGRGIHVLRSVPCALHGNSIKFSMLTAIQDDSRQPWEAIAGNDVDAVGQSNGWGLSFCDVCHCAPDSLSAVPSATVVDCRGVYFGTAFPTNLPATTTTLIMSGPETGLLHFNWESLEPALRTIERIDLHDNPALRALPVGCGVGSQTPRPTSCTGPTGATATPPSPSTSAACSLASFSNLRELTMDGTDLTGVQSNTFQFPNLAATLDTLSLVSSTVSGLGPDVNLTGFRQLSAVAWYNTSRCPAGFFSTKLRSDNHRLCYRCPRQTFSNRSFQTSPQICRACLPGTVDSDFDPTTPCVRGSFTTSSAWDPANFTFDIRQNYTLGTTYSIEAPATAMSRTSGQLVTTADLFTGALDDPHSNEDGPNAIEYLLSLFTRNSLGSRQVLNVTEAGSTVLVNPSTGAAFINFTHRTFNVEAELAALDASKAVAILKTWTFDALPADTLNASYGPNGRDCADPGQREDLIELDLRFTCNCTNYGATGENCETRVQAVVKESDETTTTALVSALVVVAVVAFIVIMYLRHRVYVWKMRVEDMTEIQASLLKTLGLAGIDMQDDESAIVIQFADLELASETPEATAFCNNLRTELSTRYAQDQYGEAIRSVEMKTDASCVIKFGPTILDYAEDALAVITSDIEDFPIDLTHSGGIAVSTRCFIAVKLKPPREIEKKNVMRLELIGKGGFGEVYRGLLQETHRGVPSCLVAMKMMLTTDKESRDELLNEGALMGAFKHFNIINVIGVVTIPKDLPAILLIEYCEHGSLLMYLAESDAAAEATVVDLMTFCADVAAGLAYLHRMRFVHRDIAARNVLVDSAVHCKIADFGMSMVVDDKTHLDYVEIKANAAARWCSPEALTQSKFSPASDTWAFGVLVHEVFTYGAQPYEEVGSAHDVKDFVRSGGFLKRDDLVPERIYNQIMLPCFERDVEKRVKMSAVHKLLAKMGGHDSSVSIVTDKGNRRQGATSQSGSTPMSSSSASGNSKSTSQPHDSDLNMDGISVHHLVNVLASATSKGLDKKMAAEGDKFLSDKDDASVWHMVQAYVMPATAKEKCAYVEWLPQFGADHVGRANALLSYCWGYKYTDVIAALKLWCETENRNPKRTYVWICSLCVNQHDASEEVKTADFFKREFGERVKAIGTILPLMIPWDEPLYLTRAWCLFELYTAISFEGACEITAIFTPEQQVKFRNALTTGGYKKIDDTLAKIRSENATATIKADEDAIKQTIVETLLGGYQGLDNAVGTHLHTFFTNSGAIKSAGRVKRLGKNSASTSTSVSNESSYSVDSQRREKRKANLVSSSRSSSSSEMIVEPTNIKGFHVSMIGKRVTLKSGDSGVVRFVGKNMSKKPATDAVGVELDTPTGTNSGSVGSAAYFKCKPNHGVLVSPDQIKQSNKLPSVEDEEEMTGFGEYITVDGPAKPYEM